MKKSITWRITITFVVVIVFCLASVYIFNILFLEKLYIRNRKQVLVKAYHALDEGIMEAYANGYELKDLFKNSKIGVRPGQVITQGRNKEFYESIESNLARFLREIQNIYNISIVLVDSNNNYYSLYQNNQRFDKRIMSYIFQNNEHDEGFQVLEETEKYKIATITNDETQVFPNVKKNVSPVYKTADIECFGFLSDNATNFFMTTPITSLKEPIEVFNRILVEVSIIIIIIGSIIIYITSYRLTIPIKKLAHISEKMSSLDFMSKYDEDREDEIGVLGKSMNKMSYKLEETIGELKSANIKLKEDIEQRNKLDEMRQDFIANVSHELKTPIALIQGYAEGLQCGMAENKENRDYYVNVIMDEANKMNRMVRQLLDLSSIESEIGNFEIARINLKEVVMQVTKSQDIVLNQKNIDINIDIDENTYVWMDEFKLEEVIRNYLTNAINHIDENKRIVISAKEIENDRVRFMVYNSGEQLSDENLQNVWEKFYKTDKARTRMYGGTGLGLSIVKAIAEKINTSCGCYNVDNKEYLYSGIVFYFDLSTK